MIAVSIYPNNGSKPDCLFRLLKEIEKVVKIFVANLSIQSLEIGLYLRLESIF